MQLGKHGTAKQSRYIEGASGRASLAIATLCGALRISACAEVEEPPDDAPRDVSGAQALRASRPRENKALNFAAAQPVLLSEHTPTALFGFELSAPARVELSVIAAPGGIATAPTLRLFSAGAAGSAPTGGISGHSVAQKNVLRASLRAGSYVVRVHAGTHAAAAAGHAHG